MKHTDAGDDIELAGVAEDIGDADARDEGGEAEEVSEAPATEVVPGGMATRTRMLAPPPRISSRCERASTHSTLRAATGHEGDANYDTESVPIS